MLFDHQGGVNVFKKPSGCRSYNPLNTLVVTFDKGGNQVYNFIDPLLAR